MWGIGGTFLEYGEDEQHYREFQRLWKQASKFKYPEIKMENGRLLSVFDFVFDIASINWVVCPFQQA